MFKSIAFFIYICYKIYYFSHSFAFNPFHMKKVSTIFILVIAFVFNISSSYAQNKIEINRVASERTLELRAQIKFSSEQQNNIYDALVTYETRMAILNENAKLKMQRYIEEQKKIYNALCENFKSILTPEQYDLFIEIEKHKTE